MNLKINNFTTKYYTNIPPQNPFNITTSRDNYKQNYIPILDIMGDSFTESIMSNKKLYITI